MTSTSSSSSKILLAAIDAGTQSTRCLFFDTKGTMICQSSLEMEIITPKPGFAEHNPLKTIEDVVKCLNDAFSQAQSIFSEVVLDVRIGITNHRESTLAWNLKSGKPLSPCILWLDTRTTDIVAKYSDSFTQNQLRKHCGLPISTYFSATKMIWLLENTPSLNQEIQTGNGVFGTVDSWIIYNLTGQHVTDVTNASRTLLMDIKSAKWSKKMCDFFSIPSSSLPKICSSAEVYGKLNNEHLSRLSLTLNPGLTGSPLAGCLGDQQAALVGQLCKVGNVKSTYGTGCFILSPTGTSPIFSNELLTTVGHQLGKNQPLIYALESAIPIAGSAISWFCKLFDISSPSIVSDLAMQAYTTNPQDPSGKTSFLTTFGEMQFVGMTNGTSRQNLAYSVLSSFCIQAAKMISEMEKASNIKITKLLVDGGVTRSSITMTIQSNLTGLDIIVPEMIERTAFGAALAAGIGSGVYSDWNSAVDSLSTKMGHSIIKPDSDHYDPSLSDQHIQEYYLAKSKAGI